MEDNITIQLRDNAKQQLAEIKTIETGLEYLNKVKAIETWVKAEKKDAELQNIIAEQKIRTQRILGELIIEGQQKGEIRKQNDNNYSSSNKQVLEDYGITKKESSAFQQIASLPDEIFEHHITEKKSRELTTSAMLFAAKEHEQYQKKEHAEWTPNELQLLEKIKAGQTVLINMNKHLRLLKHAEENNIYVRIDRFTEWGNPFINETDGPREDVCYWFENYYFPYKKSLHNKIEQLRGKVLGCHCYPQQCHGETYIKYLHNKNFDFKNC